MDKTSSRILGSFAWPQRQSIRIYPIFIPYLGCPGRCVFCSQRIQTGSPTPAHKNELLNMLARIASDIEARVAKGGKPFQIAFYGGTFTAIPDWAWQICLNWFDDLKSRGLAASFRCSTRPDCLDGKRLAEALARGLTLVELGIQSFDDEALAVCKRGYSGHKALAGIRLLKALGIHVGIQLMPGMPKVNAQIFSDDLEIALSCDPACLRFYPCLVIEKTALAEMWKDGSYTPWNLEDTIEILSWAWLGATRRNVPVIRMGLAPQDGFKDAILAGPVHPALGGRIMAQALFTAVSSHCQPEFRGRLEISAPASVQGLFWGWRGELGEKWQSLGIDRSKIKYWSRNLVEVRAHEAP